MQGEYRTKFILALLGHACLGLSSKIAICCQKQMMDKIK